MLGSEAKTFCDSDLVSFESKEENFNEYIIFGYVAGEETLHKSISALEAGHCLVESR